MIGEQALGLVPSEPGREHRFNVLLKVDWTGARAAFRIDRARVHPNAKALREKWDN